MINKSKTPLVITSSFFQNRNPTALSFTHHSLKFPPRFHYTSQTTQIPASSVLSSKKKTSYTSLVPPSFFTEDGFNG